MRLLWALMLKLNAKKLIRGIDRLAWKHRRVHNRMVQKLERANRRAGGEARQYLAKRGQQVSGLRFADSKRRLLPPTRKQLRNRNSTTYFIRIRGAAHKIDAGRWVPRGRKPGKLRRAPTPRSPTTAKIQPTKGLFLVRRKTRGRTDPHFHVLRRDSQGKVRHAKITADFGATIRKYWRGAAARYQRRLVREIDLAGLVKRG